MKRTIFSGVLVVTAGFSSLWAQTPPKGPAVKSPAEGEAVNAVSKAVGPDSQIKAAEDLLTKFADTDFKEYALSIEARAYQERGRMKGGKAGQDDAIQAQIYGERALAINPHSFTMELLVGEVVENTIQEHDLDKKDKVAKCEKLLNGAMEDLKAATKPNPKIPDADWESGKKFMIAQDHNDLGTLALAQKQYDDAAKEFQLALDGDPDQDKYAAELAQAYLSAGKIAESIAVCDKLLAKPNLHPQIKAYVTNVKTQAAAKKQ